MKFIRLILSLLPLLAAATVRAEVPASAEKAPLVLLAVTGTLRGTGTAALTPADQEAARLHVEALAGRLLAEACQVRLLDPETMATVRADAEKWAVLQGNDLEKIRGVLETYQPDWLVRVTYRTSEIVPEESGTAISGTARFFACGAGVDVELIPRRPSQAAAAFASPPNTTPKRRLKALETAITALDDAAANVFTRVAAGRIFTPEPAAAPAAPGLLTGKKVLFVVAGTMDGEGLAAADRARAGRMLETELGRRLAAAFGVKQFDEATLATARKNAEQWAVLQGGTIEQIRDALKPYALDYCLRVRYHAPAALRTFQRGALSMYAGTASVTLEVLDLRADRGTKAQVVESPPMGTNDDPAEKALDPFSAAAAALTHCADRLLERLTETKPDATAAAAPAPAPPAAPPAAGKPGVAVLWVKPAFAGWSVPRSTQPGFSMRHQKQVNEFVRQAKTSGEIGMQVSQYLVQGIQTAGRLTPVEEDSQARADIAGIRNKLLELRMAGWVGEKLPYNDPAEAGKAVGADFTLTAQITRIEEPQPLSISGPFAGAAKSELKAWAEVTLTDVRSGRSQTFTGEGSMSKTGWSTGATYVPGMSLDSTLLGGAIREALFNAARKAVPLH